MSHVNNRSSYMVPLIFAAMSVGVIGSAQAEGGGTGATQGNPNVVACIAPGADGKPSRKLSSEEVCPTYAFWREDCLRAGTLGEMPALIHCGRDAMGLKSDDAISTGSIRPAR